MQVGNTYDSEMLELFEKSGGANFTKEENQKFFEEHGTKDGEEEDAFGFNQGGLVRGAGKILKDRNRKVRIF